MCRFRFCNILLAAVIGIAIGAEFRQNVFEIWPTKEVYTVVKELWTRSIFDCADTCMSDVNCTTVTYNSYDKKCLLSQDRPENFVNVNDNNIVTVTLYRDIPALDQLGTSFLTGFMCNGNGNFGTPYLLMVSPALTNVTVTIPFLGIYEEHHLLDGFLYLQYSTSLMPEMTSVVTSNGIQVTSEQPISLYSVNYQSGGTAGTLEIPKDSWGQLYIVDTHNSTWWGTGQILVVAAHNNTEVTLELPSGTLITVMLDKFDTYQLRANDSEPLAGTIVSANDSIAVHAGHMCANVPDHSVIYCDNLRTAVPPVNTLGRVFIVPYQKPRTNYSIGIVAPHDGTFVKIMDENGNLLEEFVMNKQDSIFRSLFSPQTISLSSTQDVLVTQYGHGSSGVFGDPSLTIIPAIKQFGGVCVFAVPATFDDPSVVSITMRDRYDPAGLLLNGSPLVITESTYVNVPGEGVFNVVYIDVYRELPYSISHIDPYAKFAAILYARNTFEEITTVLGFDL